MNRDSVLLLAALCVTLVSHGDERAGDVADETPSKMSSLDWTD